jgi:hypothetical protein
MLHHIMCQLHDISQSHLMYWLIGNDIPASV